MKIFEFFFYHINKIKIRLITIYELYYSKLFLKITNKNLSDIIKQNRIELENESPYINNDLFKSNNYGIQERIFKKINEPVDCDLFYSDLIVYFCKKYFLNNLNYLEIGGSVLKNALLVSEVLKKSSVVVFDINEINPLKKKKFFSKKEGENIYFQGNVLDKKQINHFHNIYIKKFNFIFSDALHTSEGIMNEYKLIYGDKLQDDFIIYFDDLDFSDLLNTAKKIALDLKNSYPDIEFITFKTFGWIGSNEPMHLNGLITNLKIFDDLKKEKIKLFKLQRVKV